MKTFLLIFALSVITRLCSQTKIVFTAIDYQHDEVRAVICNSNGSSRTELGFNKTYLPVWLKDKILLNSDTFIWQCDTSGSNLQKLLAGYRVTVSNNENMFAFYDKDGIAISDVKGNITKRIEVSIFEDAAITWSKNDDKVSFFDPDKKVCFLFNLTNDSIEVFGDSIYHPLWNLKNDLVLFNKAKADGRFDVVLKKMNSDSAVIINSAIENAVVPIWSNDGSKVAFLSFETEIENSLQTDLFPCKLVLYDLETRNKRVLSADAGFTDKAFPQMCFDGKDEFISFTKINENGIGSIARVNLQTFEQEVISKNPALDERFPHVKSF